MKSVLIILLIGLIGCSSNPSTDVVGEFKDIDFKDAVSNNIIPLEITFGIPENFVVKDSKNLTLGTLWGIESEISEVIKTQKTKTKTGFFRIFISINTGFDPTTKKFLGEDDMSSNLQKIGATNVKVKRHFLGGYDALVTSADLKGKKMFSCHIATYISTNVVTILFYSPEKLKGNENLIWEKFISSIKRKKAKLETVKGENADNLVKQILNKNDFKQFQISLLTTLDEKDAESKPTIKQILTIDHSDGFKNGSLERENINTLEKEGMTTSFSQPWNLPPMKMKCIKNKKDSITTFLESDGKSFPPHETPIKTVKDADASPIQYLTGYPLFTLKKSNEFLEDLFSLFELNITSTKNGVTTLTGLPNIKKFEEYIEKSKLPKTFNGVPFVDELIKRFSKIEVLIDSETNKIKSSKVSGMMGQFKIFTEVKVSQIQN